MGFQSSRSGYTVRVDGLLLGATRFVVQAAVEYDESLSMAERDALAPRAQLELLLAIVGEEERGWRLGARSVHVGVLGDEPLYRVFRTRSGRAPSPPAAPRLEATRPASAPAARSRSLPRRARGEAPTATPEM
jgi:hypothetical protein